MVNQVNNCQPYEFDWPAKTHVVGELLKSYRDFPMLLGENIMQATLPNGLTIDVGWKNGCFLVKVFRGGVGGSVEVARASTSDVVKLVEKFIDGCRLELLEHMKNLLEKKARAESLSAEKLSEIGR